ncbi:MAG: NADH-quinone oxidoreductase subunit L [Gemmataceae bacterium]
MPDFHARPGLLFVLATVLPLASFTLILLASFAWCVARRYRATLGERLYQLFGGDTPGRIPAYVALAAMVLSFGCVAYGSYLYHLDHTEYRHALEHREHEMDRLREAARQAPEAEKENLEEEVHAAHDALGAQERAWNKLRDEKWRGLLWRVVAVRPLAPRGTEFGTNLDVGFSIDTLSCVMFLMVTFIATLIHLFSMGYMADEAAATVEDHQVGDHDAHLRRRGRFGRFFMYLSLFCFSMLNLLLADNLFQVFVSWELVGVCSYLLIGFYYERQSASDAANKAFITNRIGDAGFILGLIILFGYVGTLNFDAMFGRVRAPLHDSHEPVGLPVAGRLVRGDAVPGEKGATNFLLRQDGRDLLLFPSRPHVDTADIVPHDESGQPRRLSLHGETVALRKTPHRTQYTWMPYWMLVAAGLGIFLGCVGKSAQFPLQVWLPDAMEGPTPVSALIHAATMVAAGVYLVGRCYPLFTPEVLLVIAYVGAITLFVAASIALVMTDIKKVLAYSTVSQLGYMMLALGVGGWAAGLFHLVTHAFFKALLFLGAGAVIYNCHHEQDLTRMGGLFSRMRITALTMLMGVLAIAGIPFFSGWYSKDSILAQAVGFVWIHPQHGLLFLLPLMTAGLTTFYMFRMWFLAFTGSPRDEHVHEHASEAPWTMTVPLVVLAVCSVAVAWGWPLWDARASWLEQQLHSSQHHAVKADFGHVEEHHEKWPKEAARPDHQNSRQAAHELHHHAGFLALFAVLLGTLFAVLTYYSGALDPDEAREQFPGVYAFLQNRWYFDQLYSVLLVRPTLVVARAFQAFDLTWIDGWIHGTARGTVQVARIGGRFDSSLIDGLVNLVGRIALASGAGLRVFQTGFVRSYVLFLVLAVVLCSVLLLYFVALAVAGGG